MKLFTEYSLKDLKLKNRLVLAPMTRSRALQPGDIPSEIMAKYYAQRASAGLLITEATQISQQGKGYSFTPGIYSPCQIDGWKKVTEAVHSKEGIIFSQLWHVGRISHESFHNGELPVAPSAVPFEGAVWVYNEEKKTGEMVQCPVPRELSIPEIKDIVNDFAKGASNAIEAGFDGVEIHGANGYLIDQFLRSTSNVRHDEYGGSIENRLRFPKEVIERCIETIGNRRVGIRLAPFITARGMECPYILDTILELAKFCQEKEIAYIHLSEADWDDAPVISEEFRKRLREIFSGCIIVAGRYTKERAEEILQKKYADLVAFGRNFIANPDLPNKYLNNIPLKEFDKYTLFGGDEKGYTDY